jgi:23S rRNA pseudouridine2605 synthase
MSISHDKNENTPIRLQVYLAHAGVASRRASEALITAGRVSVNGAVVTELGTKVGEGDQVSLDGKTVVLESVKRYIMLNKPPCYLCSASDPEGRPLAKDLLKAYPERLYNVGRLDYLSSGLILFTNDGEFAHKVGHPSSGLEKEYYIQAAGPVPDDFINDFCQGVEVEDVFYKAKSIERLGRRELSIVLVEGKNREIRRMFSAYHLHPAVLRRVRIGKLNLGTLAEGQNRPLANEESGYFNAGI